MSTTYRSDAGGTLVVETYTVKEGPYNIPQEYKEVTRTFSRDEIKELKNKVEKDELVAGATLGAIVSLLFSISGSIIASILGIPSGVALGILGDKLVDEDYILEEILELTRKEDYFKMEVLYKHNVQYNPDGSVASDRWIILEATVL